MLKPIGTTTKVDLMSTSADYKAMLPYWNKISAINGGVEAMRKRTEYLPRFPQEAIERYRSRLASSVFTDIFSDISENLASKPFSKEVRVTSGAEQLQDVIEDIDGSGNHLHIFAANLFDRGIAYTIDWILVDYPTMPEGATRKDEIAINAKPYWLSISAERMLWVDTAMIGGKEEFVFAKISEVGVTTKTIRGVDKDEEVQRVRILKRDQDENGLYGAPYFELWERGKQRGVVVWELKQTDFISIGEIPLVAFYTGKKPQGSFKIKPPLRNVADLQIEHYQQQTNLKTAREQTAFPMIQGVGVSLPVDPDTKEVIPISVGAYSVLATPPASDGETQGRFEYLEISGQSLAFLSSEVDKTEKHMRELGRQPLMAGTSGITQTAAAFASQKASSAVQSWAFMLKDALERAFILTAKWRKLSIEPEVAVNTDFAIEIGEEKAPQILKESWQAGAISTKVYRDELKRRGILSPEYDGEKDDIQITKEEPKVDFSDPDLNDPENDKDPDGRDGLKV